MTVKLYKFKLILVAMILFILVMMASCGGTSNLSAETTENTTTTPITTEPVTTTAPVTTTTPTTTENPDAWKEKVDVQIYERWDELYFRGHDAYEILIQIKDVHNVGQRNAEAAFAKQYGFEYNEVWLQYLKSDPYRFVLFIKSQDEIEAWAKLEEVDKITCNFRSFG